MELTPVDKPVVLVFHESYVNYPVWFKNIVHHVSLQVTDDDNDPLDVWFGSHYGAEFSSHSVTFPNQETYTQCVLAWS